MIKIVLDMINPVESINTSVNEPTLPGTNNWINSVKIAKQIP